MKHLLPLFLLATTLLANFLQGVDASFSKDVQKQLFKRLHSVHHSSLYPQTTYTFHKGWNQLTTPKNGLDVIETFQDIPEVKLVIIYDDASHYWAGFTLDQKVLKDIKEMLLLRYLEPHKTFFVLTQKSMMLKIKSSHINTVCQKIIDTHQYEVLEDSGLTQESAKSQDKRVSIKSRYHSHEYRGFYDDTRVVLIYKKIAKKSKKMLQYGPAEPTIMLHYGEEYANKKFFLYDYLEKKCYEGLFPSLKTPPFPLLKELRIKI